MKILIGSPILQDPKVLKHFLSSLDRLEKPDEYEYFFMENNNTEESRNMIYSFDKDKTTVESLNYNSGYAREEVTHNWPNSAIIFVAALKNRIIEVALSRKVDYLFLTDSDNYFHPKTITQLLSRKKDIITEIQWTKWKPDTPYEPNVWIMHPYNFAPDTRDELEKVDIMQIAGFGGLSLLSSWALKAKMNYTFIDGLPWMGEDRHFGVAAAVRGFQIFVDCVYPVLHLYRTSDIDKIPDYDTGKIDR